jgi:hypothetical protein
MTSYLEKAETCEIRDARERLVRYSDGNPPPTWYLSLSLSQEYFA